LKKFIFLVTAAILNGGRSEQEVTTLDKDLARNISAKYGSNPSSGSTFGYPTWLPGTIKASDWLKFQRSSSPILHGGWK
jgi:hypothetical protein